MSTKRLRDQEKLTFPNFLRRHADAFHQNTNIILVEGDHPVNKKSSDEKILEHFATEFGHSDFIFLGCDGKDNIPIFLEQIELQHRSKNAYAIADKDFNDLAETNRLKILPCYECENLLIGHKSIEVKEKEILRTIALFTAINYHLHICCQPTLSYPTKDKSITELICLHKELEADDLIEESYQRYLQTYCVDKFNFKATFEEIVKIIDSEDIKNISQWIKGKLWVEGLENLGISTKSKFFGHLVNNVAQNIYYDDLEKIFNSFSRTSEPIENS